MLISKEEYANLIKEKSPPSKSYKTIPCAFLIGGGICVIGQLLGELFIRMGLEKPIVTSFVSICLIGLSAILTGLHLYDDIAKFGGAGTLVPITGFANAVVSPAVEFKSEGLVLGLAAKMFVIAGPVLVFGTLASVIYGFILWIISLL